EGCGPRLTRDQATRCALEQSPELAREREDLAAARGRVGAVTSLPSPPTLSLTASRRSDGDRTATNFGVTLAQELAISGERGLFRDAAAADVEAERLHLEGTRRAVAAEALAAYYDALA